MDTAGHRNMHTGRSFLYEVVDEDHSEEVWYGRYAPTLTIIWMNCANVVSTTDLFIGFAAVGRT